MQVCLEAKGHHFETSTKDDNLNCRGKTTSEYLADTGLLFSKSPVTAATLEGTIRGTLCSALCCISVAGRDGIILLCSVKLVLFYLSTIFPLV